MSGNVLVPPPTNGGLGGIGRGGLKQVALGTFIMPMYMMNRPMMLHLAPGRVEEATPYVVTRWRRVGGLSNRQKAVIYPLGVAFLISLLAFIAGSRWAISTPWGPAPYLLVAFAVCLGAYLLALPFTDEQELVTVDELTTLGAFRVAAFGSEYDVEVA